MAKRREELWGLGGNSVAFLYPACYNALMKRYKYYAFDWDGTLMHTKPLYYRAFLAALEKSKEQIDLPDNFGYLFGEPCDTACEKLGVKDPLAFRDLWLGIFLQDCLNAAPYPGTAETLRKLKEEGAALYLITSRNDFTAKPMMEMPVFAGLFSGSVVFENVKKPKPDPESLHYLEKVYGIDLKETLMVGDSTQDYGCAKGAGVDFASAGWNGDALRGDDILVLPAPEALLS